jgi:energy-converting hydrogenase Eha subunit E
MDPAAKGNVLMFAGAMLVLGTFWLLLAGWSESDPLRLALGAGCAVGAVVVFRTYAAHIKK